MTARRAHPITADGSDAPRPTRVRHRTFRSLRIRNYRLFFIGQLISICGTWMQSIAQATYVLYRLNGGGRQLGILSACTFIPILTIGLWAGAVVDRGNKRKILIGAQTLMGLAAICQTIVVLTGTVTFPILCLIAFVFGIGTAFDMPARQAFVSEMVPPEELQNAVSLNSAVFNSGRVVGQALAGVLVSAVGYAWCFGINAFSFGAIIIGFLLMRTSDLLPAQRVARAKGQIADGLRYVGRTPVLRTVILLVLVVGTFSLNFQVFVPLLAKDVFHGKESKVALFQVLMGVGSLIGSLLGARRSAPSGRLVVRSSVMFSLGLFGMAFSNFEPLTWLMLLITGGGFITFMLTANATLQLSSDPALRGRVMALYGLVFAGTTPIGAPFVGWVADTFGPRQSVAVGATAGIIAAAAAVVASRRGLLNPGRGGVATSATARMAAEKRAAKS